MASLTHKSDPRPSRDLNRRAVKLAAADSAALALSLCFAYAIRFDFRIPEEYRVVLPTIIPWVVLLKLVVLFAFRQFHILPDFFSIPDLKRLARATVVASALLGVARWYAGPELAPPRGVIAIDFLLAFLSLTSIRVGLRLRRERRRVGHVRESSTTRRLGIVGAGEAGATLVKDLRPQSGLETVAFFDDDRRKWRAQVHGVTVLGPPEVLLTGLFKTLRLDEVVISMPSASPKRIREVVNVLQQAKLKFRTVPSLSELALGKVTVSQLRPVEVEDLLGRPPVQLETDAIRGLLAAHTILVTGAGGSIGSELCRQIAAFGPSRLLLVERSEVAMFAIEQELILHGFRGVIRPLVVDILDRPRMRRIFDEFRPRLVFHAAAHKHVPMMESQPGEAIRNNTLGTALVAELALEFGVERFVLISTDKAINPTSVMGATKRLAEMYLQSLQSANSANTRLMAVRFGNVLGSSGSVIPTFKQQIAKGGPVTVTDPEMTRYFMTIPEAVGLVLQSASQGVGGEIFVLDMGKPVKILDLARQLIELSGLEPGKDIAIEFIGLRPGEKLFEELNYTDESLSRTAHPKIFRLRAQAQLLQSMRKTLQQLSEVIYKADAGDFKRMLKEAVPEYQPHRPGPLPPTPAGTRAVTVVTGLGTVPALSPRDSTP